MEAVHIVQRVPGEFIKNLGSTNLQPKDARKTGATQAEILCKVNKECQKNGLPPFWEETDDDTGMEAMLEAVEEEGQSQ
jgi:hypothetical protein